jgi:hypothetical protein
MNKKTKLLFILIFFSFSVSHAQNQPDEVTYHIEKSDMLINVDGILDEETWKTSQVSGGFYQTFPTDNQLAKDSTQFMMTYDDQFIYVAAICYDFLPGDPITNTLKRDFSWIRNDNISFYIDPYDDKSNGFTFQVTPDNVQREGLVILGGEVQDDWDNKWFSGVSKGAQAWYVEMAIPYKSIRYNSVPEWNIQLIRNNQKRNERSAWISVPQQFRSSDMTYTGKLNWDVPPPKAGTNVAVIPYVSSRVGKNHEDGESTISEFDGGFDAKIGLTNSVNLDLTFNPDFSQVEVDQQVTNLQRFEISFPERRQFFLENQDLFAENGFRTSRPFFSRRIGIQGSGSTQRNVPIIGGARISGKIGNKWRIGILNMTTDEDKTADEISPAQNYSVAVIERQIFKRSRISGVFVGRTNLGDSFIEYDSTTLANSGQLQDLSGNELDPADTLITLSEYNYVYGLDYNLATVNNRWQGTFYYHNSIDPERNDNHSSYGGFLRYQTTKTNIRVWARTVGDGYNAEVGFIPRTGVTSLGGRWDTNYFTKGKVQRHGPSIGGRQLLDANGNVLDKSYSGNYEVQFLNSSQIQLEVEWQSVTLTDPFDPSRTDGLELGENEELDWVTLSLSYNSDNRKPFSYNFSLNTGDFYNGKRSRIGGNFIFRNQPIYQLGVNFEYNKIDLPDPFNDADLFLVGPRFDLTLTNTVFFTTFVQYNTQDENLGHNSRFQWRFKPVSDLFIVYTDNYFTDNFSTRNRALVVKLSYWLNL